MKIVISGKYGWYEVKFKDVTVCFKGFFRVDDVIYRDEIGAQRISAMFGGLAEVYEEKFITQNLLKLRGHFSFIVKGAENRWSDIDVAIISPDITDDRLEERVYWMNVQKTKDFWMEEATEALQVAWHLFDKEDYSYALFFGHLAIEKLLKAVYVVRKGEQSPYIHNLKMLAEIADVQLTEAQRNQLIKITAFNLESRYPDEKRSFRKKCNEDFTRRELNQIEEVFTWLKSMLQ